MNVCLTQVYVPSLDYTYYLIQIADEDVNVIAPFKHQRDLCAQNERFSLIRWGSQVDLVLPLDSRYNFETILDDTMHVNAGLDKLIKIHQTSNNDLKSPQSDEVFRQKRIVKNPIKFKIPLNEEQKSAKEKILNNTLTVLAGKAGSGKTLLACQIALDGLLRRHYEKIIITRPTVSKEEIGFLPWGFKRKNGSMDSTYLSKYVWAL